MIKEQNVIFVIEERMYMLIKQNCLYKYLCRNSTICLSFR